MGQVSQPFHIQFAAFYFLPSWVFPKLLGLVYPTNLLSTEFSANALLSFYTLAILLKHPNCFNHLPSGSVNTYLNPIFSKKKKS
jgi:hypothetical protein